jgi:hypothetical protein
MSSLYARGNAILPFTPSADHSGKEGYLVTLAVETATISASATVPAEGVILDGRPTTGKSAIGILGGLAAPIRMLASGAIVKGDRVQQAADGSVVTDAGPGTARVVVGLALEAAVAGQLFEVASFTPMILP